VAGGAPDHAARSRRVHDADVADARTGVARGAERHRRPGGAIGIAVADAVLRIERGQPVALQLEPGQAHALGIVVGALLPLLVEHALHALGDQIRLGLDVESALARRRRILALDLPRALGLRPGRRAVGEEQATVGSSLLQNLRYWNTWLRVSRFVLDDANRNARALDARFAAKR